MRKIAQHILVCATLCFSLLSCNVHQWPEAPIPEVDVNLTLTFDTDMPLLAIIDRMNTYASTDPEDYDVRYRINAYRISDNGSVSTKPTKEWIFSRPEIAVLDYSTPVTIAPGNYRLYAWADYVDNNSVEDKFYSTDEFTGISILGSITTSAMPLSVLPTSLLLSSLSLICHLLRHILRWVAHWQSSTLSLPTLRSLSPEFLRLASSKLLPMVLFFQMQTSHHHLWI